MLTRLRFENFKAWKDTGDVALKPITGFFGRNSSGKTSLFQALLMMKQTATTSDRGIVFHFGDEKTPVDLGDFESVIFNHDTSRDLKLLLGWTAEFTFDIPPAFAGGSVAEGDEVVFEVTSREIESESRRHLVLEEMSYEVAGTKFGMRRDSGRESGELISKDSNSAESHTVEDEEQKRVSIPPQKFHHFPYSSDMEVGRRKFLFDLQYEMDFLFRYLYYLGPLRAYPNRIYTRSGAQPVDMGAAGELVVDAILSSRERGEAIGKDSEEDSALPIDRYVGQWLSRLGLAQDFRVETLAEARRIFEVRVRNSPKSSEVLLTDIGFGVSQILPVLVLCFYVPMTSTVILEQPEIHLHPAAQSGLADVFVDAVEDKQDSDTI